MCFFCVCECMHVSTCAQMPAEASVDSVRSPGGGVTGCCEPSHVGADNRLQVLCKAAGAFNCYAISQAWDFLKKQ